MTWVERKRYPRLKRSIRGGNYFVTSRHNQCVRLLQLPLCGLTQICAYASVNATFQQMQEEGRDVHMRVGFHARAHARTQARRARKVALDTPKLLGLSANTARAGAFAQTDFGDTNAADVADPSRVGSTS